MSGLATIQGGHAAAALVAEYRGSDVSRASIELMKNLEAQYLERLVTAEVHDVIVLQALIKQLRKLRGTFEGETGSPVVA